MPHSTENRPLSPHLSVYRPQITSVLSISHRATGVALYFGSLLIVAWLVAAAYHAPLYHLLHRWMLTPIGGVVLLLWTLAFFFHFANGFRHLWWDTGHGLTLREVSQSGWIVIIFTLCMTGVAWWLANQPLAIPSVSHAPDVITE
ncbi:MAG: succinate dehydrogenase, cytochrome b556 subunit [Alphaproteobacteria bacterium]|nr:succinate dehydrogenase, cytochrome b556 subunit [Alphaproteobacteria bacterium]